MAAASPRRAAAKASPKKKRRPLAFLLHNLVGLNLSLLLGFICLTGTIATVSHEIEWLAVPQVRATTGVPPKSWGTMWNAVQTTYPEGWITNLSSYDRNNEPYLVRYATVIMPSGQSVTVLVDPGTGQVTGSQRAPTFPNFMRALHYYLFIPGAIPFYIVTAVGIMLLVLAVTGLLTYKKFWRGFLRMPRWDKGLRAAMGDMHRLVGLWSSWFAILIGITCVWYMFEYVGPDLNSLDPGASRYRLALPRQPDGATIDRWCATAAREMPGLAITAISPPTANGEPASVQGQWHTWLVRERANAVFIDPQTEAVLGVRDAGEMSLGERIVHTADPLHFGNFGGLVSKLIWVVFGLALVALSVTGAVIFTRRSRDAARAIISRRE